MVVQPTVFNAAAGILNLEASAANPYSILLRTRLDIGDRTSPGAASNFNPALGYAWKFADASAVADLVSGAFDPAIFNIDVSGFANSFTGAFAVELRDGGKNLYVVYTPPSVATNTTLTATPNATTGGELVTFTATVSPNPGNLGTMTFRDNGVPIAGGSNIPLVGGTATFQISTLLTGAHPVTAAYSGATGFAPSVSAPANLTVTASPPQVLSVTPNGNLPTLAGAQRSQVFSLQVVFNQPVQLDPSAMALALHTNNVVFSGVAGPVGSLPTNLIVSSIDNITWLVTFAGNTEPIAPSIGLGSIKDGVYNLNIDPSKVHPLGAPTVNAGPIAPTVFHRLFGDADGATQTGNQFTAHVNTADNGGPAGFRAAFNTPANYKAFFDFDGDGFIATSDNLQFRNRFNRPLTWSA